jgi:hypothetical protein
MDSTSQDTLPKYTAGDYNYLVRKLERLYTVISDERTQLMNLAGKYEGPSRVINLQNPDNINLDRNKHTDLMEHMDEMNARYKELFGIHNISFTDENGNRRGGSKKSRRKTRRKR